MSDKKELPLAIAEILIKYTDEKHLLSTIELIALLNEKYGLTAERRTIYANIELLQKYGMDIGTWQENGRGYFLKKHFFLPEEAGVLKDAVNASDKLTKRKKKELTKKINSTLSVYQIKDFQK